MNRIVHLALKVENLEKATQFYEEVFGFKEVETRKTRDHISRHMTDGIVAEIVPAQRYKKSKNK